MAKKVQEINAGSMADIAFLLLIFFLVSTTMNTDTGLIRNLPPWVPGEIKDEGLKVKERNVLKVKVAQGSSAAVLVGNKRVSVSEVKDLVREFISYMGTDEKMPERKLTNIPQFGNFEVSSAVVSLQNDRGTLYQSYIAVQNEITRAYNEVRNALCEQKFGIKYTDLPKDDKRRDAIEDAVPVKVSEADPVDHTKK